MAYDKRSMSKGEKGEAFFENLGAWGLFMLPPKEDNRKNHREGDFTMYDGHTVEVKTDYRCLSTESNRDGKPLKTGRIPIEMQRRKSGESEWQDGWYWHCMRNDVSYLVFYLYRQEEDVRPHMGIMIEMQSLISFITRVREDKQFAEQVELRTPQAYDWPNGAVTKLYTFPLEVIQEHCLHQMQYNVSYLYGVKELPETILYPIIKPAIDKLLEAHGGGIVDYSKGIATFQPDDGDELHKNYIPTEAPPNMTAVHIFDDDGIIASLYYEEVGKDGKHE